MRSLRRTTAVLVSLILLISATGCTLGQKKPKIVPLYPAYVVEDGTPRWGYINDRGKFAISPAYQSVSDFGASGLAVVEVDDRYGVIDAKGNAVVAPAYSDIYADPVSGTLIARNGDQYKVLSRDGAAWFASDYPVTAFSEGLAPFALATDETTRWGYVREDGTVAIEPRFLSAGSFSGGKAIVREGPGHYAIIDVNGASSVGVDCAWAGDLAEGFFVFRNDDRKYGYMSVTGDVLVEPKFDGAEPFRDGQAVVEIQVPGDWSRYGLINKQGNVALAAQYSSLRPIGGGLYAVGEWNGSDYYVPEEYQRKAIMDRDGNFLTEYRFYDVGDLNDGLISVTDFTSTYLIDATGNPKAGLPCIDGIGEMKVAGNIVQARIDDEPLYVTKDGKLIWQPDNARKLDGDLTVTTLKYRPNRLILVRYPELYGPPGNGRDALNARLRDEFLGSITLSDSAPAPTDEYAESYTADFDVERRGDLLIIQRAGYSWPMGAAHGMPSHDYYHIDLTNEKWYSLADLFRPDSGFTERLTALVTAQMAAEPDPYWFPDADPTIRVDHLFTVTAEGLVLFYHPYEIASYAEGFPSFTIPWSEIQDIVDTEGGFWRALHAK